MSRSIGRDHADAVPAAADHDAGPGDPDEHGDRHHFGPHLPHVPAGDRRSGGKA